MIFLLSASTLQHASSRSFSTLQYRAIINQTGVMWHSTNVPKHRDHNFTPITTQEYKGILNTNGMIWHCQQTNTQWQAPKPVAAAVQPFVPQAFHGWNTPVPQPAWEAVPTTPLQSHGIPMTPWMPQQAPTIAHPWAQQQNTDEDLGVPTQRHQERHVHFHNSVVDNSEKISTYPKPKPSTATTTKEKLKLQQEKAARQEAVKRWKALDSRTTPQDAALHHSPPPRAPQTQSANTESQAIQRQMLDQISALTAQVGDLQKQLTEKSRSPSGGGSRQVSPAPSRPMRNPSPERVQERLIEHEEKVRQDLMNEFSMGCNQLADIRNTRAIEILNREKAVQQVRAERARAALAQEQRHKEEMQKAREEAVRIQQEMANKFQAALAHAVEEIKTETAALEAQKARQIQMEKQLEIKALQAKLAQQAEQERLAKERAQFIHMQEIQRIRNEEAARMEKEIAALQRKVADEYHHKFTQAVADIRHEATEAERGRFALELSHIERQKNQEVTNLRAVIAEQKSALESFYDQFRTMRELMSSEREDHQAELQRTRNEKVDQGAELEKLRQEVAELQRKVETPPPPARSSSNESGPVLATQTPSTTDDEGGGERISPRREDTKTPKPISDDELSDLVEMQNLLDTLKVNNIKLYREEQHTLESLGTLYPAHLLTNYVPSSPEKLFFRHPKSQAEKNKLEEKLEAEIEKEWQSYKELLDHMTEGNRTLMSIQKISQEHFDRTNPLRT